MKARAFIFDVYGTLLEVGSPPTDADQGWQELWRETFGTPAELSRLEFSVQCGRLIAERHARARERGIGYPEVCWPSIVTQALPALAQAPADRLESFILRQIALGHSVSLTLETVALLRWLASRQVLLGIASNAQAYTLRELRERLEAHGLGLDLFEPDLCFWSYEHGFSKPDPHVFQLLSARLEVRGISPAAAVMVGDRLDNDVEPARRHGWQTWHCGAGGNKWADLRAHFETRLEPSLPHSL